MFREQNRIRGLLRLYLVMGLDGYEGLSAIDIARKAIAGGVTLIQLREKEAPLKDVLSVGRQLRGLCKEHGIPFVVNDRVDVALLLDADGVHVGQDDVPASAARSLLGPDKIVGVSAGSLLEAAWAVSEGADYLGVGPIYPTGTKKDAGEAVGTPLIGELKTRYGLPIVGIGGINVHNAAHVVQAGADGIAVVSAITRKSDPMAASRALREAIAPFLP